MWHLLACVAWPTFSIIKAKLGFQRKSPKSTVSGVCVGDSSERTRLNAERKFAILHKRIHACGFAFSFMPSANLQFYIVKYISGFAFSFMPNANLPFYIGKYMLAGL